MKHLKERYRTHFSQKEFVASFVSSFGLLVVSLVVNFFAGTYALERASCPVTDIILNNTRVYDVDTIFIYGPIVFWSIVTLFLLSRPRAIPFVVYCIALFVLIRSVFVMLTHIGPFPNAPVESPGVSHWFTFGGDLFFSGHVGLPFLLALIFWNERHYRYLFLFSAAFFSAVVLLGHYHYSIDVLAAFFITYAIRDLGRHFFPRDYARFHTVD
jgi:hypothetical protein